MDISNNFWLSVVIVPTIINIGTTILGIVATVFWIDGKLKEREEKKWLPSQHFIYSKMMKLCGRGLRLTLPTRFVKSSDQVYHFGQVTSSPDYEINTKVEGSDLYSEWQLELKIFTKKEISQTIDRLVEILSELNEILAQSAYLIKPDLLKLIFNAREELERIQLTKSLISYQENLEDISEPDNLILTHELISLVAAFENILKWLFQKADKQESQKEYEKWIFGDVNRQPTQ